MEIKDRIIQIIEAEQLTSSKFADTVGVQRSSISHILSGRNNPSLEIIQKILTTFGTLNSEWLLFGRGQMYKTHQERKLFEPEITIIKEPELIEKVNVQPNPTQNKLTEEPEKINIVTKSQPEIISENTIENKSKEIPENNSIKKSENKTESKTEKIIIFNSDRTFTEYFPN
jgi:transcriptional regulator with XRE-family HTH domain